MLVLQAVRQGAAAVLMAQSCWDASKHTDYGVPVLVADDLWEAAQEVAVDLYSDPSVDMLTIGIAGQPLPSAAPCWNPACSCAGTNVSCCMAQPACGRLPWRWQSTCTVIPLWTCSASALQVSPCYPCLAGWWARCSEGGPHTCTPLRLQPLLHARSARVRQLCCMAGQRRPLCRVRAELAVMGVPGRTSLKAQKLTWLDVPIRRLLAVLIPTAHTLGFARLLHPC